MQFKNADLGGRFGLAKENMTDKKTTSTTSTTSTTTELAKRSRRLFSAI